MKKVFSLVVMVTMLILFLPVVANAHWHSGYSHERGVEEYRSKWMDQISDSTRLSDLSIPGTHDSMSNGPGGDIVQTQSKSLRDQLDSGIRFIDIRTRVIDNVLTIHHGSVYLNENFGGVLNYIIEFLNTNPSETVFMRLKQEYSSVSDAEYIKVLNRYIGQGSECEKYIYSGNNRENPTLGEMRGKIVILRNFNGSSIGIDYAKQFKIQDNYHLNTNWDLYDKWNSVKNHLNVADYNFKNDNKYINYLTGSGGSFPYFVASGHVSPGTSASRLSTGFTEPAWAGKYPDFPRTNWFLGMATIAFEGTNVLTTNYIAEEELDYTGIVVADFPGQGLINSIINLNRIHEKNHVIPEAKYTIVPSESNRLVLDISLSSPNKETILWPLNLGENQQYILEYHSDQQAYQISSLLGNNLILAWNDIGGNMVFAHPNEKKPEHYWVLEKKQNNLYYIRNKKNLNMYLTYSEVKQNTKVTVQNNSKTGNLFKFERIDRIN
ncbi:hypothetical protein C6N01_13275 [Enterococcus faecalis]|uniref:phosphatidylinositol-specific phospholipase C n=1 Tax=Enterococcus faecalis TaxID=1351 RepID=UPI0013633052|nr:phosphatidylinositol-specific phospholipase C [Enterococcus faecalis]NBJ47177.1 hypothetical protein [Enterococcus faecalis]